MMTIASLLPAAGLIVLDIGAAVTLYSVKLGEKRRYRVLSKGIVAYSRACDEVISSADRTMSPGLRLELAGLGEKFLLQTMAACADRFVVPTEIRDLASIIGHTPRLFRSLQRRLRSIDRSVRMEAAFSLRFFGEAGARALAARLPVERSSSIGLRICGSILFTETWDLLPAILERARADGRRYGQRVLSAYVSLLQPQAARIAETMATRYPDDDEGVLIAVWLARRYPCEQFESILLRAAANGSPAIAREAARVLQKAAPALLDSPAFVGHSDPAVRGYALKALGRRATPSTMARLLASLDDPQTISSADEALRIAAGESPEALKQILRAFYSAESEVARDRLASILDDRIDFFLLDLRSTRRPAILRLVANLTQRGNIFGIVSFLNRNNDPATEKAITETMMSQLAESTASSGRTIMDLSSSLRADIRLRLGLPEPVKMEHTRHIGAAARDKPLLGAILAIAIALPLALFALSGNTAGTFVSFYLYYFGWYSTAINTISLILLVLSTRELARQLRLKRSKSESSAFLKHRLPSVSIIVPAFKEEASIDQTVRALLSQRYPDFEVVVVNDGSPDRTLGVLIDSFALERRSRTSAHALKTAPELGYYRSALYPNLAVVDKANGGKADSLNAGINVARGDYFCGIDADSLLEPDALLRAASAQLDEDAEIIAVGGNILPVNGCTTQDGALMRIGLPKNALARFQTAEYVRAFLTGRLGWSRLNALLIISGAFGLFSRRRVIDSGGYLTRRSRHGKDTVGEDMELVVRLTREARERSAPYAIRYAFDANCWTEVPEDLQTLSRQRDRWQRGLLEIVLLHRKMMGNPRYGRIGTLILPYYLMFETIGPIYELAGWLMMIAGVIAGLVPGSLALFVFTSAILMGVFISISSLVVGERQVLYFSPAEDATLIGFAIAENFGFRQLMGAIRVGALVSYLLGAGGWGAMKRKGFGTASGSGAIKGQDARKAAPP
jgi:cellulose synthase/poly-beta-1,6-N-acetylglucosamine synthase-like glycosyltransferase